MAEATDGRLNCFGGVSVEVSGLEGQECWLPTYRKEVGCHCNRLVGFCLQLVMMCLSGKDVTDSIVESTTGREVLLDKMVTV